MKVEIFTTDKMLQSMTDVKALTKKWKPCMEGFYIPGCVYRDGPRNFVR